MIDYPICRDGGVRMRFRHIRWLEIWAVVTTGLLLIAVAFPQQWTGTLMSARLHFASAGRAFAQTPETPARLEWLGWQFFRLTSPGGKIILLNPIAQRPQSRLCQPRVAAQPGADRPGRSDSHLIRPRRRSGHGGGDFAEDRRTDHYDL